VFFKRSHSSESHLTLLVNCSYTRTTELSEIINLANFFLLGTAGCGTTITPGWPSNSRRILPALVAHSLPISSTEYVRSVPVTLMADIHCVQRVKAIAIGNVALEAPVQPQARSAITPTHRATRDKGDDIATLVLHRVLPRSTA
jgi:hypothetical protein